MAGNPAEDRWCPRYAGGADLATEGFDEQRVAAAGRGDLAGPFQRRARVQRPRQLGGLEFGQGMKRHDRRARLGAEHGHGPGGAGPRVGARRRQHQQGNLLVIEAEEQVAEQIHRGGVGPVEVVDEEHARRVRCELDHQLGEGEELPGPLALDHFGGLARTRFALGSGPDLGQEAHVVLPMGTRGEGAAERGEQRLPQREVGEVEVLVAAAPQDRRSRPSGMGERFVGQSRLADALLPFDDHEVREATGDEIEAGAQPAQLHAPSDECARRGRRPSEHRGGHAATLFVARGGDSEAGRAWCLRQAS